MKFPNFNEEKKLWRNGYKFVAGLDEAGRGPLAGPVVASAVLFNKNFKNIKNLQIKDGKKLSAKQREYFYKILTNHKNIKWGIGIVSEKVIDEINILEATKLAMTKAIESLGTKHRVNLKAFKFTRYYKNVDFLLIDGNQALKFSEKFKVLGRALSVTECSGFDRTANIPQKTIIKGDEKVFSISAAGIIAKVTRDNIMKKLHKKYPKYGFNRHKGYGTVLHIKSLQKIGPCPIHRKTFYPVKKLFTG